MNPNISIQRTLRHEDSKLAGIVTKDTGGVTRWGIAQNSNPGVDIVNLTLDDACKIYKKKYWDVLKIDGINCQTLADSIYDWGVNAGPVTALKYFFKCLNTLLIGNTNNKINFTSFGPIVNDAINSLNTIQLKQLQNDYVQERINFYTRLARRDKYKMYLKGWTRRAKSYQV